MNCQNSKTIEGGLKKLVVKIDKKYMYILLIILMSKI